MTAPSRFYLARLATGRPRLLISVLVAVAAYCLEPADWLVATRLLIAWNVGTILFIISVLAVAARATTKTIIWRSRVTDEGKWVILVLTTLAAAASLGAIFAQLTATKDLTGTAKALRLGLAGLTLVSAWVFIHLTFAMHYAHEYFDSTKNEEGERPKLRGGLRFPETDEPDYWDFLYFSFIIGVACQTADVEITSKAMRRTSLAHSILAFFFNSAIRR